ncbi:unnamed protein product [Trifolium pratense]|uniref:Uncharacterized protein n=1 Tax=Trifolium pratense TaxID=57577 RepID=A0ACB0LI96_TRIPR|nr:unnamed protein product [Trifolium pratense]
MYYLSVLVLFLATITLTLARNHNNQIHEENARSNIVLISYQQPNPQKQVTLHYGPSNGPNQQRRRLRRSRPHMYVPAIPSRFPRPPSRPPPLG